MVVGFTAPVAFTNKIYRQNVTEILSKFQVNRITKTWGKYQKTKSIVVVAIFDFK
jgi:hypothetical protein